MSQEPDRPATPETAEHVDVLIVGAGLSGIGAACRLVDAFPRRSVAILEAREASGGTWDLFRYPGVRSDSDMFTFSYRWRPWPSDTALASGETILGYIRTVAAEHGVDEMIRYRHKVSGADWDSAAARWTVTLDTPDGPTTMTCSVLWGATGYYDYDTGHDPRLPGVEAYEGELLRPQFWPDDLDYAGKKVVVIGSGATAVTLVPSMAPTAAHVTMLQRSPTYIIPQPGRDPVARALKWAPDKIAYPIVRWSNVLKLVGSYQFARRFPKTMRKVVRQSSAGRLPDHVSYDEHFAPSYNPWDQRLCVVPDGDLFKALGDGSASIVTDTIDTFTPQGIRLSSGQELEADIVVSATGLKMLPFGGLDLSVDGKKVDVSSTMSYRGLMLTGIPNFIYTIGYTNASWTLKADLVCDYAVKLLRRMDADGVTTFRVERDPSVGEKPFMELAAGYVQRALDDLPKQGDRKPWQLKQNYLVDRRAIQGADLDDGVLQLT